MIEARPQITEPAALPEGYCAWDCLGIWKVSANQRVQDILNALLERNTRSSAQLCGGAFFPGKALLALLLHPHTPHTQTCYLAWIPCLASLCVFASSRMVVH